MAQKQTIPINEELKELTHVDHVGGDMIPPSSGPATTDADARPKTLRTYKYLCWLIVPLQRAPLSYINHLPCQLLYNKGRAELQSCKN